LRQDYNLVESLLMLNKEDSAKPTMPSLTISPTRTGASVGRKSPLFNAASSGNPSVSPVAAVASSPVTTPTSVSNNSNSNSSSKLLPPIKTSAAVPQATVLVASLPSMIEKQQQQSSTIQQLLLSGRSGGNMGSVASSPHHVMQHSQQQQHHSFYSTTSASSTSSFVPNGVTKVNEISYGNHHANGNRASPTLLSNGLHYAIQAPHITMKADTPSDMITAFSKSTTANNNNKNGSPVPASSPTSGFVNYQKALPNAQHQQQHSMAAAAPNKAQLPTLVNDSEFAIYAFTSVLTTDQQTELIEALNTCATDCLKTAEKCYKDSQVDLTMCGKVITLVSFQCDSLAKWLKLLQDDGYVYSNSNNNSNVAPVKSATIPLQSVLTNAVQTCQLALRESVQQLETATTGMCAYSAYYNKCLESCRVAQQKSLPLVPKPCL